MSRTYKATGINLRAMPLGESDRLLMILTREFGLIRAVAPGARKYNSSLSGRSGLFVVNDLLLVSGRSLDKITQAETIESYPGLSQDLGKLAASQYLAEIVLAQALSEQPQIELFCLLNAHLKRLEQLPSKSATAVLAHLSHGVFHLLVLAGIKPQVQACCLTHLPLLPDFSDPNWRVGFSIAAGGTVSLSALRQLEAQEKTRSLLTPHHKKTQVAKGAVAAEIGSSYQTIVHHQEKPVLNICLNATELTLLQQLTQASLPQAQTDSSTANEQSWLVIEQTLRQYVQYHQGSAIRSATLLDSYFGSLPNFNNT